MKYIYQLFWFFAGSDKEILAECPTSEKNKHFGIGATILITAVAAVISGTYAVQTLSDSPAVSILIGIFWGFVIFNIDRLMVATLKKDPNNSKWKEAIKASPRLLLAIAIAVVISKPVEVKILENQIDKSFLTQKAQEVDLLSQLNHKNSKIDNVKQQIDDSKNDLKNLESSEQKIYTSSIYLTFESKLKECKDESKSITLSIDQLRKEIKEIKKSSKDSKYKTPAKVFVTTDGKEYEEPFPDSLTGNEKIVYILSKKGNNEIYRKILNIKGLKKQYPNCSKIEKEKDEYVDGKKKGIVEVKENLNKDLLADKKKEREKLDELDSLRNGGIKIIDKAGSDIFGKLIALEKAKIEVTSNRDTLSSGEIINSMETESTMMANISWAIMFFFFLLELCPILVKILADRGPYDDMLETQEIVIREKQRLLQREAINETDTEIEMMREKSDTIRNTELGANQELIDQVSQARMDIARQVVAKWKDKQIADLESNPEEFIDKVVQ
jgi:hypothetical protein